MENILKGLPSLLGVIGGIFIYGLRNGCIWLSPIGVFIVSFILLNVGKKVVIKRPRAGLFLIETWIVSAICITAIGSAVVLWITVNCPNWFNVDGPELDAVSGAFVGAISTYFAIVWTKDIAEATGPFWPSTQFKAALSHCILLGDTKAYDAAFERRVRDNGPTGWGLSARWRRAAIIAKHLKFKNVS